MLNGNLENLGHLVVIADGTEIKIVKALYNEDEANMFADGYKAALEELGEEDSIQVAVLEVPEME